MTRRNDDEKALKDAGLSALLRDAYAGDPALEPAPGRTERIMRSVLASVPPAKPARSAGFWSVFAWSSGALAAAALVVALIVGFGLKKNTEMFANNTKPHSNVQPKEQPPISLPRLKDIAQQPNGPTPEPNPQREQQWQTPQPRREQQPRNWRNEQPAARERETPPSSEQVMVASALYSVGKDAYNSGEYETAYQAFRGSYDAAPTPDALLNAGNVLIRMAQDELDANAPRS